MCANITTVEQDDAERLLDIVPEHPSINVISRNRTRIPCEG